MNTVDEVRAIGRDRDALEVFYRTHIEAVQRFVARRVETAEDAADLTAEVFLAAMDAARNYRGDAAAPRAWLYGIARHVVANHHRRTATAIRATQRLQGRDLIDPDAADRIVARLDSERDARELWKSLRDLPPRQRAVVELIAVDGLTHIEAAQALGITSGHARVLYHRARRRLARQFDPPPATGPTTSDPTTTTTDPTGPTGPTEPCEVPT